MTGICIGSFKWLCIVSWDLVASIGAIEHIFNVVVYKNGFHGDLAASGLLYR